jgi:hypothetical protein
MGHGGVSRYLYTHSASGGIFTNLLTTVAEYPLCNPLFSTKALSKGCLHHKTVTLVTICDQEIGFRGRVPARVTPRLTTKLQLFLGNWTYSVTFSYRSTLSS